MDLAAIQDQLRAEGLDGWLFYDHHRRDPIAYRVLSLEGRSHVSRRWYYWIPASGEPAKLVHRIEAGMLDSLPGERSTYSSWGEMHERLRKLLAGAKSVAMQYSPDCMIPYVSLVDGGMIDLIRGLGVEVASSATLVQYFEARWSDEQAEGHFEAGRRIDAIRADAFAEIGRRHRAGDSVHEMDIVERIRQGFADNGLITDSGPVVAVGPNSSIPHYDPSPESSAPIRPGDFVLIDLWAKLDRPGSVYYDVTWTGFCGPEPPEKIQQVFDIVCGARDVALEKAREAMRTDQTVMGYQVDDACRQHIRDAGYGELFVHRTGHSIGEEVHGNGANIDNLETRDERPIIPRVCFSIEPGIYLEDFGVRSEIDCYVSADDAQATGEVQRELVRIV